MFKLIKRTYETIIAVKHVLTFSVSTLSNLMLNGYFLTGDVMLNEEYLDMIETDDYRFLC